MREREGGDLLEDSLDLYLQQFKNVLGAKLTLVESLCNSSNSLQSNPAFLVSRYSSKQFGVNWKTDPQAITVHSSDLMTINRFYLRIYEYLELRLSGILSIGEGVFIREVQFFQKELEEGIRRYQSKMVEGVHLGELFGAVNRMQNAFVGQLLDKIGKGKAGRGMLDADVFEEVGKLIRDKINKEAGRGLREGLKIIPLRDSRLIAASKTEESPKLKNYVVKRMPPKKEPTSPLINLSAMSGKVQKIPWRQKTTSNNMEQQQFDLQNYLAEKQTSLMMKNYGIMNLDEKSGEKMDEGELLVMLEHRNLKNQFFIQSFLNKYERKMRRRSQRNQSERVCRSSTKAAKTVKNEDSTIFQNKIDSMHNIQAQVKNPSEQFKKIEGSLELPMIITRHTRKNTFQK